MAAPHYLQSLVIKKQVTYKDKMTFITNLYLCFKSYLKLFKWVSKGLRSY